VLKKKEDDFNIASLDGLRPYRTARNGRQQVWTQVLMRAAGEASTQLRHSFPLRLPKPLFLGAFAPW
jgi:hypothetical protein